MTGKSIAVIAHDCKSGGAVGAVAWRQVIELSRSFQVFVITRDMPDAPNTNVHPVLIKPRQWDFLRRFCHVPNDLSFQAAARNALGALCRKNEISVVWCHSHAAAFLAARPLRRRYGFKTVMTIHGDIFERPTGTYEPRLTAYYKAVTRPAYRCCDAVQALSPYFAEQAIKNGADQSRVSVIPNGIDPADIGAGEYPPRTADTFLVDGIFRILFVGGLLMVKGVDLLIQAAALLKKRNIDARITIVGDGPERERLRALCKKLGVEDIVVFAGKVAKKDLHTYYRNADVLCMPSRSEALPTVALEAFAMGLPVAGSSPSGIPYLLQNGQRGFIFKREDINELTDTLALARQSRERLAELSRLGQASAANEFSWPRIGRSLRELVHCV